MVAVLAACGGGYTESDLRDELADLNIGDTFADCAVDQIKEKAGSFEEFGDLSESEQKTMAAEAGAACVNEVDPENLGELAGELDLEDPDARASIITGMTSTGVPEDVANCIIDEAVAKGYGADDLMDEAKITDLANACQ